MAGAIQFAGSRSEQVIHKKNSPDLTEVFKLAARFGLNGQMRSVATIIIQSPFGYSKSEAVKIWSLRSIRRGGEANLF